ncbi:MAG TPA: hypothetical protein VMU38_06290 [Candidatus Binatia bacterium]|nr:hypothetical protein [Candidatus Binatia bacterium]
MSRLFLAALLAVLPIAAVAATLAPSAIVATPSTYDGQTVTVAGTVQNFMSKDTAMGKFSGFQLCDSKCINVIDKTNQSHTNGSSATVTGTFHASFKAPHKTWSNALVIGS